MLQNFQFPGSKPILERMSVVPDISEVAADYRFGQALTEEEMNLLNRLQAAFAESGYNMITITAEDGSYSPSSELFFLIYANPDLKGKGPLSDILSKIRAVVPEIDLKKFLSSQVACHIALMSNAAGEITIVLLK